MKVILLKDVAGVGLAHEVVESKDGYALNYLIPKKLAIMATPGARKEAELRQRQREQRNALDVALLEQSIVALADKSIVIKTKANEKNHLYDAIGESEILTALEEQAHLKLPKGAIQLEKSIKELGTFTIPISIGTSFGSFSLVVQSDVV